MTDTLDIEVRRIFYPAPEKGGDFYVLGTNLGKCVGAMKWRPEIGERLSLEGRWQANRGEREWKFTTATPNVPTNPRDMLEYAASRAKGIGPAMVTLLWEKHGADWMDFQAGDVQGLTETKAAALREAVNLMNVEAEKSKAIGWLMGKGATLTMATSAFERWKGETIGVAMGNCYRLADLDGFSFVHVDGKIREAFGIALDDRKRIRAAILYRLRQLTEGGSTVVEWKSVKGVVIGLVGGHLVGAVAEECKALFAEGRLVGFAETQGIALRADYDAEVCIMEYVAGRVGE